MLKIYCKNLFNDYVMEINDFSGWGDRKPSIILSSDVNLVNIHYFGSALLAVARINLCQGNFEESLLDWSQLSQFSGGPIWPYSDH